MKRSKSSFDVCSEFGKILSFGELLPNERQLNSSAYSNIHFMNTLEVQDPISIDK